MTKHTTTTEPSKTLTYVGLDVHKETIAVAVAEVGKADAQVLGIIPNDEKALRSLMRKLGPPAQLRVCYEAGPCGYVIYRSKDRLRRGRPLADSPQARRSHQDRSPRRTQVSSALSQRAPDADMDPRP
jgi:hypothetical protein